MNVAHECGCILFGIGKKVEIAVFECEFTLGVENTDCWSVQGIINGRNNHRYKYLVTSEKPCTDTIQTFLIII